MCVCMNIYVYICICYSLVAQRVKRLPAMQETEVPSMGWEDPLEKEMATHSSTLAWKFPWTEKPGGYSPWGRKELDTTERLHLLREQERESLYNQISSKNPQKIEKRSEKTVSQRRHTEMVNRHTKVCSTLLIYCCCYC